jgi:hypothetical protein
MLCGTDNIMQNINHIHIECKEYSPYSYYVCQIFREILSVRHNIVMALNNVMQGPMDGIVIVIKSKHLPLSRDLK